MHWTAAGLQQCNERLFGQAAMSIGCLIEVLPCLLRLFDLAAAHWVLFRGRECKHSCADGVPTSMRGKYV